MIIIEFTKQYHKLVDLEKKYSINNTLKITFQYHYVTVSAWYTHISPNVIAITLESKKPYYLFGFSKYLSFQKGFVQIETFLEPKIYHEFSSVFQKADPENWDFSTTRFFLELSKNCVEEAVVKPDFNILNQAFNNQISQQDKPYFHYFKRSNMSYAMKRKVQRAYPEDSKDILLFCEANNLTTVFTSQIEQCKPIHLVMNYYQN